MASTLLPLFPLRVVVFPRTHLPLHIFEDRYREMVGQAIQNKSEFGVVLSKEVRRIGAAMMKDMAQVLMETQGLKSDDIGYWVLIVSDVPTAAADLNQRLAPMTFPDSSLLAVVQHVPEALVASRTSHWAAYYVMFGAPSPP